MDDTFGLMLFNGVPPGLSGELTPTYACNSISIRLQLHEHKSHKSHRSQHFQRNVLDLYATSPASTAFLHKQMTSMEGAVDV